MVPAEFLGTYGYPRFRSVVMAGGTTLSVPSSPDRYLIAFSAESAANVSVAPMQAEAVGLSSWYVLVSGVVLTWHFGSHGAMPMAQWSVFSAMAGGLVGITECFAPRGALSASADWGLPSADGSRRAGGATPLRDRLEGLRRRVCRPTATTTSY